MPIFSRRLSDTTWCSTVPAEPKKNGARMWSKDKMGGSPITVHLQNKSYQFVQRWLINIYLFAVVKKYSCSFLYSIFSIGVIQFCIPYYIPFILLSTSGLRGSKGACFLHSYSSLESQIGWRFGRFSIWTSLKKTPHEKNNSGFIWVQVDVERICMSRLMKHEIVGWRQSPKRLLYIYLLRRVYQR